MTLRNEDFVCLSDDYPVSGRCVDCGVPISGEVAGDVSDDGAYSLYIHKCSSCGHSYMRLFQRRNIL